jgi:thymidine phosphorylase
MGVMLHAVDVITTKRDGGQLTERQIRWFVDGYTHGRVHDEQAAALLMAILIKGMRPTETATWTEAIVASGERLDLSSVGKPTVDKHSSGGVGDKVSMIVAPIVAACGAAAPKLSSRGLGHTGGTIDKLSSIPGLRTALSTSEVLDVLREVGCVICETSTELAPADKRLYALRNATGTIESFPLIASSIMAKKIAGGADSLVLDVKVGSGAFVSSLEGARTLAETLVEIGEDEGVKTTAVLTRMDAPLGKTVGNALEVAEAFEALRGNGSPDLMEVAGAVAAEMVRLAGVTGDPATALSSGAALERFEAMIRAQGGDPQAPLPTAAHSKTLNSSGTGYLAGLDARKVGIAAHRLGAGRTHSADAIGYGAGIVCLKKPGDPVEVGEPILELRTDDEQLFDIATGALEGAIAIGDEAPATPPMVIERLAR